MQTRVPVSLSQNDPGNYYQQVWLPCTRNETINHYMSRLRFPASFRVLCEQWRSQGKPHLISLRYPEGLQYGTNSGVPENLEVLSSLQEVMTLSMFAGYMRENIAPTPRPFSEIASHMHIYCSIKVELAHRMYQFSEEQQDAAYERQWRALQEDFNHDRAFCQSLARHDCVGYLLYGEVYHMPRESISQSYQQYQLSSPLNKFQFLPLNLTISNPPTVQPHQSNNRLHAAPTLLPPPPNNLDAPINGIITPRYQPSRMPSSDYSGIQSPLQSRTSSSVVLHPPPTFAKPLNGYSDDSSMSPEGGTPTLPFSIHQSYLSSPPLWQQSDGDETSQENSFFRRADLSGMDRMRGGESGDGLGEGEGVDGSGAGGRSIASTSTGSMQVMNAALSSSLHNSDSRAEQNRLKSKRHYERKKLQRSLLYDLVVKMESTLQFLLDRNKGHLPICRAMHEVLTTTLPAPDFLQAATNSEDSAILQQQQSQPPMTRQNSANEKKKLNKKVQNYLEMQRMVHISQLARTLHPYIFVHDSINIPINASQEQQQQQQQQSSIVVGDSRYILSTSTHILLSQSQEEIESIHKNVIFEPQDAFLLNWLHCRTHWQELIAAENRLIRSEDRPTARLITFLTAASPPSNAAGPSSADPIQHQEFHNHNRQ